MIYGLQTDNLYSAPGAAFIGLLNFPDYTLSGDNAYTFALIYGGNTLEFIVNPADDPDSGYNLPPVAGATYQPWLTAAMARLQSNYFINRDFSLDIYNNAGVYSIRFTAKAVGAQYVITTDTANQTTLFGKAVAVINTLQAGVAQVVRPNFKIMIEVWMWLPDGSDAERLSQAFPDVEDDGTCIYDISGTISDGLAAYGFDRPNLALPDSEVLTNSSRKYYLQIAEVFGEPQVIRAVTATPTQTAIYGGFSKRMMQELLFPDFFSANPLQRFLDQELSNKTTHITQPEFLTFCQFLPGPVVLNMQVTVNYSTGNPIVMNNVYQYPAVAQYTKICFPVGYGALLLSLQDETRTVVSWSCVLVNGTNTAVSETKTYVLDYTYRPYGRYLLYQNSFGGYISNFVYGKSSREYDLTYKSSEITPTGGFNLIDGEVLNFDNESTDKLTVVTGFMPRRALLIYRDFILSVDKFLIDNGKALPIGILSDSIKEFKDGDNLYSQSFDITFQWSEEMYTYNPEEVEPFSPADVGNYSPPNNGPDMPENFDDRYYLKTLTYSAVQIDNLLATETAARVAGDTNLQTQINAINVALAGKMDADANFNALYFTKAEVLAFFGSGAPVVKAIGVQNPIVISDYQTAYPNFGNYPNIMILENITDGEGNIIAYKNRTDLEPQLNLDEDMNVDSITIDSPADGSGNTMSPFTIIIKAS